MDRKSRTFTVVRVLNITRRRIRITVPLNGERLSDGLRNLAAFSLLGVLIAVCITVLLHEHERQASDIEQAGQQQAATSENDRNAKSSEHTERAEQQSPPWYESPTISNWALVIVGAITFATVAWQAIETKRSADAAERSVRSNERHFKLVNQQWLTMPEPLRITTLPIGAGGIQVWFEIRNRTEMAIILNRIKARFLEVPEHDFTEVIPHSHQLVPTDGYTASALFHFRDMADHWNYMNKGLRITLIVDIKFTDAFGEQKPQRFGYLCVARERDPQFVPFHGNLAAEPEQPA